MLALVEQDEIELIEFYREWKKKPFTYFHIEKTDGKIQYYEREKVKTLKQFAD